MLHYGVKDLRARLAGRHRREVGGGGLRGGVGEAAIAAAYLRYTRAATDVSLQSEGDKSHARSVGFRELLEHRARHQAARAGCGIVCFVPWLAVRARYRAVHIEEVALLEGEFLRCPRPVSRERADDLLRGEDRGWRLGDRR